MTENDDAPEWASDLGRAFGRGLILVVRAGVITVTVLFILWVAGVL